MLFPRKEFNKISAKEAGLNKALVAKMFAKIQKEKYQIKGLFLAHEGSMVFEAYQKPLDKKTKFPVYSIAKSLTSIAIGILVDLRLINLEDYVLLYFSNEIKTYLPEYEGLKIKHLLTMTVVQEEDRLIEIKSKENPFEIFFNTKIISIGKSFFYNNFCTFILSAIVTKVTGKSLNAFLNEHLYQKIGMDKPEWVEINNYNLGAAGLYLSLEDMARFGHFILNEGLWNDERIVSKNYLDQALNMQIETPEGPFKYGYHFWVGDYVMAAGKKRQYIIIDKRYQLVFCITADEEREILNLYFKYLFKAFEEGYHYDNYSIRESIRIFEQVFNN